MGAADAFAWVENNARLDAACLTAVTGIEGDEVARRLGGDLTTRRSATFDAAFNEYPETQHLLFDAVAGGVLVAENNGWQGGTPEIAGPASARGRLASAYWSVNADMTFIYAVDGAAVAIFDPLLFEGPWWVGGPESLGVRIDDLPFGVASPRAASLALIELLLGLRIEESWLDRIHPCVDVRQA